MTTPDIPGPDIADPDIPDPGPLISVPPVDLLEVGDGLLVLYERTVIRLTDLGRAAMELCSAPMTETDLAEALSLRFGDPPDGDLRAATRAVVDELLAGGVLRREKTLVGGSDR